MTLIFIGQHYKYELESICKLFYHCQKIELEYESTDFNRDNLIITRKKKGKQHTFLLTIVKVNGQCYRQHRKIENDCSRYEKICERLLCEMVYRILSEYTGRRPKWGSMTGIRPVKNLHWDEEQGITAAETDRRFAEDYLVSEDKIKLCHMIYDLQKPIIKASRKNSVSLYVSIPFCPSRCSYCSFVSHSIASKNAQKLLPDYVEILDKELHHTAQIIKELGLRLETVYFGGGTPTTLSAPQLALLCKRIETDFDLSGVREYTVEAGRADTITEEKLRVLKQAGVSRISINPQTFRDSVLLEIGRKHTADDVIRCYELARRIGHSCINMDFIAGLPTDTVFGFYETINQAVALSPENITVHTLSVKRSSNLFAEKTFSVEELANPIEEMVNYAQDTLLATGYLPYYLYKQKNTPGNLENVGYCKPGYEGLYNIYMMEEVHSILACGGAGVTKLVDQDTHKIERIFNYKYPYEYIDGFDVILERKGMVKRFYEQSNHEKTVIAGTV